MKIIRDEIEEKSIGYIYIIGDQHEYVKVGISKDPNKRVLQLQTGHPDKLTLLFTEEFECTRKHLLRIEKYIHRDLGGRSYKKRGEWFKIPLDKLDDVKNLIKFCKIRYEDDETYFKYRYFL